MANQNTQSKRPLSPHLQVYRLPLTAKMSITHRLTGIILAGGSILIATFLIAGAMGEAEYNQVMALANTAIGTGVLFAWSLALYYHLCNGVRHMLWDVGAGLNEKCANRSTVVVLLVTIGLTVATWWCGCSYM